MLRGKETAQQLVNEVINGGHLELVDQLYTPGTAAAARTWIRTFRAAFPDVHMDIVELIAEGDDQASTVVGRFICSGTHTGPGAAMRPPIAASPRSTRSESTGCARAGSCRRGRWRTL